MIYIMGIFNNLDLEVTINSIVEMERHIFIMKEILEKNMKKKRRRRGRR